jgi:hypothetical protein
MPQTSIQKQGSIRFGSTKLEVGPRLSKPGESWCPSWYVIQSESGKRCD